jgi:NAD(P)H-hydrate epimerase
MTFHTEHRALISSVSADQMREVDRIAVEEFDLSILQMMENAGRILAQHVMEMLNASRGEVIILAGAGGNGGGGLCCARHLHNRGFTVHIFIDRDTRKLVGPVRSQLVTLRESGVPVTAAYRLEETLKQSQLVVDALIGYGLRERPRGMTKHLIEMCNGVASLVLSNDVPSGLNATTGAAPGVMVRADRVVTLAAPKTGLANLETPLYLADIGIPPQVFHRLGLSYEPPFERHDWVRVRVKPS